MYPFGISLNMETAGVETSAAVPVLIDQIQAILVACLLLGV
jgi:hypothetical protein